MRQFPCSYCLWCWCCTSAACTSCMWKCQNCVRLHVRPRGGRHLLPRSGRMITGLSQSLAQMPHTGNESYPDEPCPARDLDVCFARGYNFRAGIVLRTVLVRRLDTSDPCCCPPKHFFPGYHPAPCLMALGLGPRRICVFIEHKNQTLCSALRTHGSSYWVTWPETIITAPDLHIEI